MNLSNIRLKEIRKKLGYNQEYFAFELDIKRCTLGAYEECRAKVPVEIIVKAMELYSLPMEDMFDFIFDPNYKL